jgi:signal transduction histidine kinase/BarA-like signal transduction histidine kinase
MNVNVNLAFLSLSMLYIAFLNVMFLKKGHIKTFELDTFGKLITLNLVGILLEFGCIFTIKYSSSEILIEIVNRLFLLYLVTFVFLFSLYVFSISFDKANKKNNTLRMIIMLMYLFSVFLIFYLKLDIYNKNNIIYSYGPSTNVVYIISTICVILCFVSMIKNYKELKSKKYLPLFVFIIGGSVVALIQKINPALTLATSMEAYLLMIMYHTIENPDMKILEEVHRAKEISDNANEEKTMFLYNMTNEIRNITKDIDYSADDILDETSNKKVDVEVINDAAREIKGSTAKFTTMTNEILDINSIDSASIKVYNDKYNVKLIIKELVTVYSKKCNVKNIAFRPSIASDIPEYLYGDSVGLKQVLDIILDNSVKYTSSGYIEFNVNAIIKNNIARLIITVEDSGTGMKADDIIKVFNKKNDHNEDSLNLNNNLYNAKALITLMGGTIIPGSIYGTGTTMKIVLDQKVAKEADEKLDKYEEVYDKKKILLVDDNISTEKIVSKLLKDTNIELDYVSLGKEALDKIRGKEKYDLILLDEVMDPLDGVTVMKKFKDIRNFKTNVILLTRNNEYEYNEEYLKYGFSGYLLKPISKDKLFEIIDKYLK